MCNIRQSEILMIFDKIGNCRLVDIGNLLINSPNSVTTSHEFQTLWYKIIELSKCVTFRTVRNVLLALLPKILNPSPCASYHLQKLWLESERHIHYATFFPQEKIAMKRIYRGKTNFVSQTKRTAERGLRKTFSLCVRVARFLISVL